MSDHIKKQRSFWMCDRDWRRLLLLIQEQGFEGKGKLERFMEKLITEQVIFISGSGKFKIISEKAVKDKHLF